MHSDSWQDRQRFRWSVRRLPLPGTKSRWAFLCGLCISVVAWPNRASAADSAAEVPTAEVAPSAGIDFFERHIRPLLIEHCYECHSTNSSPIQGGLRLDDRASVAQGGDTGPAIVVGNPSASLLVHALQYQELQMPPAGKLTDDQIALVEKWITIGAPDPREPLTQDSAAKVAPSDSISSSLTAPANDRTYWSFQRPTRHKLPEVHNISWSRRTIDRFLLARMEASGLTPSTEATRTTLVRRLFFDLIGLPPTPAEIDTFVSDNSPDAYERLVETLLSSSRYGEHWTRLWLDVARYAEDQAHIVGDDRSLCYPNAHYYRDWLINAFNNDLPYDQFVMLQLAADLMEGAETSNLAALGYLGLGPKYYNRGTPEVKADEWDDRIDTVSRGLLGLTVSCARCHDHKFDPISMRDYYALAGVFASTRMYNRPLTSDAERKDDGEAKKPDEALHIVRDGDPQNIPLAIRGDVRKPGDVIARGFLDVLAREGQREFSQGSGRLELAQAIADGNNPLTARILVNRIWARHFGQPLVTTPSNFGHSGQLPTHPELLDDLAVRFMEHGWSLKWLHREIVCSATYRQSSLVGGDQLAKDPGNRWLSRMNRRRLEIEPWRDAILVASGRLDCQHGGRSVNIGETEIVRRTLYAEVSRFQLHPMLATFDYPDPNAHASGRVPTTTPLQKLFVLNSPFVVAQAEVIGHDVAEQFRSGDSIDVIVDRLYRELYGRRPTDDDRSIVSQFLANIDQRSDADSVWRDFAHALLASNELLFID